MEETIKLSQITMLDRSRSGWFWPVLGLTACVSFPYYFSLETFFSHDDFAILWFHKDQPFWKFWLFFDTRVLTFYRPFQDWTLSLLWQLFGMNPYPYSMLLVLIHMGSIVLFGWMIDRLFEDRALTFLSVILFAANWEYCDVVFWKGNYGTALSWLFALATANAFLMYLERRRKWVFVAALLFMTAALLSKESAINLPLLLALLYWLATARRSETNDEHWELEAAPAVSFGEENWLRRLREFAFLFAPFCLLAGAYLVFYKLYIRDVYDWLQKGYEIRLPWQSWAPFEAVFKAMTFWLLPFIPASEPLTGQWSASFMAGMNEAGRYYPLPLLLVAGAALTRNRRLIFGILWAVFAFLPANLIPDYHTPRYYYGSILGISVVFAELLLAVDRAAIARLNTAGLAAVRATGSLLILAFVFSGLFYTTSIVNNDQRVCADIEDVYRFLVSKRGQVPAKSLIMVHCLSKTDHFHEGMGLREMVKLALSDDSVEAILANQSSLSLRARTVLWEEYPKPIRLERASNGAFRLNLKPRGRAIKNPTSP